jgi:hypothetical protein
MTTLVFFPSPGTATLPRGAAAAAPWRVSFFSKAAQKENKSTHSSVGGCIREVYPQQRACELWQQRTEADMGAISRVSSCRTELPGLSGVVRLQRRFSRGPAGKLPDSDSSISNCASKHRAEFLSKAFRILFALYLFGAAVRSWQLIRQREAVCRMSWYVTLQDATPGPSRQSCRLAIFDTLKQFAAAMACPCQARTLKTTRIRFWRLDSPLV